MFEEEKRPLSGEDLSRMSLVPVKIFKYDDLKGMDINDVLSTGCAFILMQIQSLGPHAVGHWIALIKYEDHIEHFDSYGLTIDQELALTHEERYLSQILEGNRIKQGRSRLQEFKNDVNTCGRHVVCRCNMKQKSYDSYVHFFKPLDCNPDEAVTLMTHFL